MTKEYDLISPGIPSRGGTWADFGSGTGIFTQELCARVGPEAEIYSIDRNARDLERQRQAIAARFPHQRVHYLHADFTKPLDLPKLDGIVMANALHFVRFQQQAEVLAGIADYLRWPGGRFVLVEYNARSGNLWVPYPVDSESFTLLAAQAGLSEPEVLARVPSRFMRELYSSLAQRV